MTDIGNGIRGYESGVNGEGAPAPRELGALLGATRTFDELRRLRDAS